jgi:hypothetical protein
VRASCALVDTVGLEVRAGESPSVAAWRCKRDRDHLAVAPPADGSRLITSGLFHCLFQQAPKNAESRPLACPGVALLVRAGAEAIGTADIRWRAPRGWRNSPRAALLIRPSLRPHAGGLIEALGCATDDAGFVRVDGSGRTSVAGVWAAGNAANARAQVITAAGAGSTAAIAINADLLEDDIRHLAHDPMPATKGPDERFQELPVNTTGRPQLPPLSAASTLRPD